MFEFLFQYPARIFSRGEFVFLSGWPVWMLVAAIAAVAVALAWLWWRRRTASRVNGRRAVALWVLQSALVAALLWMIWQPALRLASLKPQQNVVAVVIDDSKSMGTRENGVTRLEEVKKTLNGGLLSGLEKKFQVRLYRAGAELTRIDSLDQLNAGQNSTRLAESLRQTVAEAAALPVGAVILISDGADNTGGIDLTTIGDVRRMRVPVHTIGVGREKLDRDIEVTDVTLPTQSLADARLSAQVTFRQRGYAQRKAKMVARSDGKVLASKDIAFKSDGTMQTEAMLFSAGGAGPKTVQVSIEGIDGEENPANNALRRLVNVKNRKPRVLYLEGEPKWEFKFIRRALEDDKSIDLVTILRTTQNKIFRQGIANPKELEDGFPVKAEELFAFDGLIIGGVEASYFNAAQQEALRQFVDRRGGGVLFLAGRLAMSDGGWNASTMAELLPVSLPDRKTTFHRDPATVELTAQGRESLALRLDDSPDKNVERWKKLPYVANYQEVGQPKPGAVVLAELLPTSKGRMPMLVTQNFGRGRTAMLATSGTWRWKMLLESTDTTHATFWQQMLRWLVSETPERLIASTPRQVLADDKTVPVRVELRDKTYMPLSDAQVELHISGPEGTGATIAMSPEPLTEGVYTANWQADKPGAYVAEVVARRGTEEVGRDVLNFRREDGVAENFGIEQNRELLTKLSEQTGGQYYTPQNANKLLDQISFSDAGITVRETRDLWSLPVVFLALLMLAAAQWLLRRRWGVV